MRKNLLSFVLFGMVIFINCDLGVGPKSSVDNPVRPQLYVMESDFQSGKIEWMDSAEATGLNGEIPVYKDALLCSYGGYLYIIERFGADNIVKYNPDSTGNSGKLYQTHLGDNVNPVAMAFVNDTCAYIACLNSDKLIRFNPLKGILSGSISLSAYIFMPDSNVSPNANDILYAEGKVYVLLQRLNGWTPVLPTLITVIDPLSNTVVDTIPLQFGNGHTMVYNGGTLYVSNPGNSGVIGDGGVEALALQTKQVRTVITETQLGGNPNTLVFKSGSRFYLQNYIAWGSTGVVELDVSTGRVVTVLSGVVDAFGGICYDSAKNLLYVGERAPASAGVKVFSDTVQIGAVRKSVNSLPPSDLVIVK